MERKGGLRAESANVYGVGSLTFGAWSRNVEVVPKGIIDTASATLFLKWHKVGQSFSYAAICIIRWACVVKHPADAFNVFSTVQCFHESLLGPRASTTVDSS